MVGARLIARAIDAYMAVMPVEVTTMRKRRWLYTLVLAVGILWIGHSLLPLLHAMYSVNAPINGPTAHKMEEDERVMVDELNHRIRMTVLIVVATIAVSAGQALLDKHFS